MKLLKRGGDGKIYLVSRTKVMKQWRLNKNVDKIRMESAFQQRAAAFGVAPEVFEVRPDADGRWGMVMERMSHTLMDEIRRDNGLSEHWQHEIIRVLRTLDDLRIFHGDLSPINFMVNENKLYVIDFGKSVKMDVPFVKLYGRHANITIGITAFVMKMREFVPTFRPELLLKAIRTNKF
jgi:tRNA A-37 threonylcarbamoyl transferase component Bud32